MPDYESDVADAIRGFTAALDRLSGVLAWTAVQSHSDTHGRQSEMAALILRFATEGYFHAKIDGQRICDADSEQARNMLDKLFSVGKRK